MAAGQCEGCGKQGHVELIERGPNRGHYTCFSCGDDTWLEYQRPVNKGLAKLMGVEPDPKVVKLLEDLHRLMRK